MDSAQAKDILLRYRPGTADDTTPEFAEALRQAQRDPELARWFTQHQAWQISIRDRFKHLPVPANLKEDILAGYRPAVILAWWRRPAIQTLAAAAAIALMIGAAFFWFQPRDDQSFVAFKNRVVRSAQRGYAMDVTTTNLNEIRQFLAAHQAIADYVLPAPLEKLPGDGGGVLRWHNKIVSMVCFDLGNHNDLYLFVAARSDLPGAPSESDPQFDKIGRLTAASWSAGPRTYVLAGPGDERFLRGYMPGNLP
jgi:uncharacterized membrane protein YbaN (DUF454 family)